MLTTRIVVFVCEIERCVCFLMRLDAVAGQNRGCLCVNPSVRGCVWVCECVRAFFGEIQATMINKIGLIEKRRSARETPECLVGCWFV